MAKKTPAKKQQFIHQLAVYLVEGQGYRSIALQAGAPWALDWAALRSTTPLFGYTTVEEAEKQLTEFLE